jgi:antitoxin (DNA-binding transcriptional repressor) of toxin-antitoxin stability system
MGGPGRKPRRLSAHRLSATIIIARNGRPAAPLVPIAAPVRAGKRLGLLEGKFPSSSQEEFDADNDRVALQFGAGA